MTSVSNSKVCRSRIIFSSSSKAFAAGGGSGGWAGDDDNVGVSVASGKDCSSSSSVSEWGEDDGPCRSCSCRSASKGTGFSAGTVENPNYISFPTLPTHPNLLVSLMRKPQSQTKLSRQLEREPYLRRNDLDSIPIQPREDIS